MPASTFRVPGALLAPLHKLIRVLGTILECQSGSECRICGPPHASNRSSAPSCPVGAGGRKPVKRAEGVVSGGEVVTQVVWSLGVCVCVVLVGERIES